jgi:hypothetical protein
VAALRCGAVSGLIAREIHAGERSLAQFRPAAMLAALGAAAMLTACATQGQTTAATAAAPAPARVVATPLPGSPPPPPTFARPVVVPAVAVAPPPSYPQHWDGSYQGRSVLVRATSPACPPSRRGVIEIGDNTLFFPYLPDTIFTTAVAADGTMHGVAGVTHLDGRVADGRLAMTISSPVCETQYTGRYVWNHSYPP